MIIKTIEKIKSESKNEKNETMHQTTTKKEKA